MNREEKKKYLESYKEASIKSKELDLTLTALKSADYTRIKTSTRITLTDRIYLCDKAYNEMIKRKDLKKMKNLHNQSLHRK